MIVSDDNMNNAYESISDIISEVQTELQRPVLVNLHINCAECCGVIVFCLLCAGLSLSNGFYAGGSFGTIPLYLFYGLFLVMKVLLFYATSSHLQVDF